MCAKLQASQTLITDCLWRLPANPRRWLCASVHLARRASCGQGNGVVLPDGCERPDGDRPRRGDAGPEHSPIRRKLEAERRADGGLRRRARGLTYLAATGVRPERYSGGKLAADQVLVVGPGGGNQLAAHATDLAGSVQAGGHLLAVGLDEAEANAFLPMKVSMVTREHIAAYFEPFGTGSSFAGVSPAEVHNRDPRDLQLIAKGATVVGNGVLATAANGHVVFCQLVPWRLDYFGGKMNVKRSYRKVSCLIARLLGNMQAAGETRLLERISTPVAENEKRWR